MANKHSSVTPFKPKAPPRRRIYELLTDHFDVESGRFTEGWSDERIARDLEASIMAVVTIRQDDYGPLRVPPAIGKFEADLAAFKALYDDELAKLVATLKTLQAKFGA